ncbi:MAG: DHH family phosphoesterase [Candidatus Nanoarchaeia archaeon]
MIPEKALKIIRDELENCSNPLFFFHDDPDGTSAYIQFYRVKKEGYCNMVKMLPKMTVNHLRWVNDFGSDKVFVFDVAMMDQEFVDKCPAPIVWLDHHDVQEISGVTYINAKNYGETTPPSVMAYQAFEKDLWLACVGAIGDWYWTDLLYELKSKEPQLLDIDLDAVKWKPEEVMFGTRLGTLVNVLSFNLKGTSKDALQSIKVFTRIESPYEILDQATAQGKFLWKKYLKVKKGYDEEKAKALKSYKKDDPFFVHTYMTRDYSVTKDLANELSYLYKDKVIILARERNGGMVMSLRSSREGPALNEALEKVLGQFADSHGGGHEHACGAAVKAEDFSDFLRVFKEELGL